MIRPIKIEDKKDWEKLYRGYADFYKVEMNDEIFQSKLKISETNSLILDLLKTLKWGLLAFVG